MTVVFYCLSKKTLQHFAKFDLELIASELDPQFIALGKFVSSDLKRIRNSELFVVQESLWKQSEVSTFNRLFMLLNLFRSGGFSSQVRIWCRFFWFGNSRQLFPSLKVLMSNIKRMHLQIKGIINSPFLTIIRYLSCGTLPIRLLVDRDKVLINEIFETPNLRLVVVQSTLSELSLHELIYHAKCKKIKIVVIIDSWDNVTSKPIFPSYADFVLLHSKQQFRHALELRKASSKNLFILGTPRIRTLRVQSARTIAEILRIAYLQGSPADDLNNNLSIVMNLVDRFLSEHLEVKRCVLSVRGYPNRADNMSSLDFVTNTETFELCFSDTNEYLESFLEDKHLVISEATTAGIESLANGVPTVFIAPKSRKNYLDGEKMFLSKHISDLRQANVAIIDAKNHLRDYEKFRTAILNFSSVPLEYFYHTGEDEITRELLHFLKDKLK